MVYALRWCHRVAARSVPLCPLLSDDTSSDISNSISLIIHPLESRAIVSCHRRIREARSNNRVAGLIGSRTEADMQVIAVGHVGALYTLEALIGFIASLGCCQLRMKGQRRGYNKRSSAAVINHRISRNTYARIRRWRPKDRQQTSVTMQAAADCTKAKETRLYRNRVSRAISCNLVHYFLYMHMHRNTAHLRTCMRTVQPKRWP